MTEHFIQQNRRANLSTSLGMDVLVLLRFEGSEEMSASFEWRVEALSTHADLDLNQILGTHSTVEIETIESVRHFDGIVSEAVWRGIGDNGHRYDLVLRPWLHVASLRRNQRIFHNKNVQEILDEIFNEYAELGSPLYEFVLQSSYPTLEYTVQYGESDAAFAMRLMERFGLSWHFEHTPDNHKLVITDAAESFGDVPGGSRPYFGVDRYHRADEEHFRSWKRTSRMRTGAVKLTEYNFKTPDADQLNLLAAPELHDQSSREAFEWPGDYLDKTTGEGVVERRLEGEQHTRNMIHAMGDIAALGPGLRISPTGDELPEATGLPFICTKANHRYTAQAYGTGAFGSTEEGYTGGYVLVPEDIPIRPATRTRRPIIHGPQTAMVVGEGEIDCDEFGRILVRFHWDLEDAYSMRCRVSQNWAGKGWGGMVIPRIGMEVVVEFLEGDPDKPLVTGCVYNGYNTVPYTLDTHKTRSTFKTDTHTGEGYNELRFEDQKDLEEIFIQAQKYFNAYIKDNET